MKKNFAYVVVLTLVLALTSFAHAEDAQPRGVVNINSADAAQLALLPGIGAKAAERIVAYRTEHGAFTKTGQLMDVKGIGEKSFERLAPYIALSGETTLTSKIASPRKPRVKKQ